MFWLSDEFGGSMLLISQYYDLGLALETAGRTASPICGKLDL